MSPIVGQIVQDLSESRSDRVLLLSHSKYALYELREGKYFRVYFPQFVFQDGHRIVVVNCEIYTLFVLPKSGCPGIQGLPGSPGQNGSPGGPGISAEKNFGFVYLTNSSGEIPGSLPPGGLVPFNSDPVVNGMTFQNNQFQILKTGTYLAKYGVNASVTTIQYSQEPYTLLSFQLLRNGNPVPGSANYVRPSLTGYYQVVQVPDSITGSVVFSAESGDQIALANNNTYYANFDTLFPSPVIGTTMQGVVQVGTNTLTISNFQPIQAGSSIYVIVQSASEISLNGFPTDNAGNIYLTVADYTDPETGIYIYVFSAPYAMLNGSSLDITVTFDINIDNVIVVDVLEILGSGLGLTDAQSSGSYSGVGTVDMSQTLNTTRPSELGLIVAVGIGSGSFISNSATLVSSSEISPGRATAIFQQNLLQPGLNTLNLTGDSFLSFEGNFICLTFSIYSQFPGENNNAQDNPNLASLELVQIS